jgi:hypothetical protein
MSWRIAHDVVKYAPAGIFSACIGASAFDDAKKVVGNAVAAAWQAMNDPMVAAAVGAGVIVYFCALIGTGLMAKRSEKARPDLKADITNIIWGGVIPDTPFRVLHVSAEIANVGEMASVVPPRSWEMKFRTRRWGRWQEVQMIDIPGPLTLSGGGQTFVAPPEDSFLRKGTSPIGAGDSREGFVVGGLTDEQAATFKGATVRIDFKDVTGRRYRSITSLNKPRPLAFSRYGEIKSDA